MAWIESHQELGYHPKLLRLSAELRVHKAQALGHLQFLWWWALDYARKGDLSAFSSAEISAAAEWPGKPEKFHAIMKKTGWIDEDDKIHDWDEYAGAWIRSLARQKRYRKKMSPLRNCNTTVTTNLTVPNLTVPNLTQPTKKKDIVAASATPPDKTPYRETVELWMQLFREKHWAGINYPFRGADGKIIKRLLGNYGPEMGQALIRDFFTRSWDWIDKSGKTVRVPKTLVVFEKKLVEMLEAGDYRSRMRQTADGNETTKKITEIFGGKTL